MQNHPLKSSFSGTAFGMALPERTWTSDSAGYRFGFGGQMKDDEVYGKGNSYTAEYWQYDSRLGRRWNVDPLINNFPWQGSYVCFDNNPINKIDYDGLKAKKPDKFTRKYNKWKIKNYEKNKSLEEHEKYELFRNQKTRFGKSYSETRWAKKHENNTYTSSRTGWLVKSTVSDGSSVISSNRTLGQSNVTTDIDISSGTMTINYNMASFPDRLQVTNTATGEVLFDTRNVPGADRNGKVSFSNGSGSEIAFNLGDGNTQISIIVNGNDTRRNRSTVFQYEINVQSDAKLESQIEVTGLKKEQLKNDDKD